MVVAQICTEDILMKGGSFEYLTNYNHMEAGEGVAHLDLEFMRLII